MSTETTPLEDMIEGTEEAAPIAAEAPSMGDTTSAAPPADASHASDQRADDGPTVPRRALEDERKKRQEIERRLAEIEQSARQPAPQHHHPAQQQEPPDPFVDPQGYARWVTMAAVSYAQQEANRQANIQVINRELNRSERRARATHGDDVVTSAFEAAAKAGVAEKFIESDDAYEDIVKWFKDYQVASDPGSYRAQIEAEILAKHGLAPQSPASPAAAKPRARVPTSLASTASAQPRDERGRWNGPTPIEDLIP